MIAMSVAAYAQTPQFEVASIKPSLPGNGRMRTGSRGGPGTDDPSLFTCENCGLAALIVQAYDLKRYQFSGPDWTESARFNISAKIPEGATKKQFQAMLQNLLADRFKLKSHREKKEMQTYDLVVGKNGPKLKESVGPQSPDDTLPPPKSAGPQTDESGFAILPPGRVPMAIFTANGHATRRWIEQTMEQLAGRLSNQLSRPVFDATGLKGKYDFTLRWVTEGFTLSDDDSGPTIFQALQEQLGLKLESKKSMVDTLVVDHVEKTPTEN
jgi:uncharacterized protein (TIGR03435 family)